MGSYMSHAAALPLGSTCNRLADASISWTQPPSEGIAGWEGRCGQTAAANMITTMTGTEVSPETVINTAWDMTPGSLPSTVLSAVRKLCKRRGSQRRFELATTASVGLVSPFHPMICLIQWDALQMHWVSVVSYDPKFVRFNHWGRSETWKREDFDKRWALEGADWVGYAAQLAAQISKYTSVRAI